MRQLKTLVTGTRWFAFPSFPKWTNNQCTVMWNAMIFTAFLILVCKGSGVWSLFAFLFLGGFREDKCVKCGRESKDGEYPNE